MCVRVRVRVRRASCVVRRACMRACVRVCVCVCVCVCVFVTLAQCRAQTNQRNNVPIGAQKRRIYLKRKVSDRKGGISYLNLLPWSSQQTIPICILPCVPHKSGPAGNMRAPSGVNDNFIRRCQECFNAEGHTFNTACNKG